MGIVNVFRADRGNVGDWYCNPSRYFPALGTEVLDILGYEGGPIEGDMVLGGGGLIARTFHDHVARLAQARTASQKYVAWGIGESENVDRSGGFVLPFAGPYPASLDAFDLVGVRDYGTPREWVPCASCMLDELERPRDIVHDFAIYEHKRIAIPIDAGFPRRSNDGCDIAEVLDFLGSAQTIITNSYHGAYWATLLGRRVVAIPNMSKMYRMKHAPVLCRAEEWRRFAALVRPFPEALAECRKANRDFYAKVADLLRL